MKKLNKLFAILVAMAMVLSLGVVSAFALDAATDDQKAAKFVLTKNLEMPAGTNVPAGAVFSYTATATAESATPSPSITIPDITFAATDTTTTNTDGNLVATRSLENIFASVTAPGKYVYEIKETSGTNDTRAAANNETFTYDPTIFTVRIYVDANHNQTFTITEKTTTTEEAKDEVKVIDGVKTAVADFDNTYVKSKVVNPNGDKDNPANDSTGYAFEKFIENDAGGLYTNQDWVFTVTFDIPDLSTKDGYNYEVWTVGTTGDEGTAAKVSGPTKLTSGQTITLKAGQRAVFTDLDVGAKVNVKEADTDNITEGAKLNDVAYNIIEGDDVDIEQDTTEYLKVTNTSTQSTTPEGILISNLPYIALALVAIGGLVAYVVIRRRNADEA